MQPDNKHYKSAVRKWGDLGNGFYRNPVLNSDYSDPDVIRVGGDFYMVCSEFHYMACRFCIQRIWSTGPL
ncbi:family 43 glycosylhydrolase [Thermoclostridium stercorarium]|uniref:family 43 glycosylhydrolase n=1 Tax=Thermoclostridium stercorarium TaxID=1510 RepID=UPI000AB0886C|nr:family 43 glycosylhydrolase [Thermoclostridium stercorarium]